MSEQLERLRVALGDRVTGRNAARCPSHNDKEASLSFTDGKNGVVVKCHGPCDTSDVLAALGMQMSDLFHEPPTAKTRSRIDCTYEYTDANGAVLFRAVREYPKKFYQQHQDASGRWVNGRNNIAPVPYQLPSLIAAVATRRDIFIVEGEKDVDNLRALGFTATCNLGGASKWTDAESAYFDGAANVIAFPDNDPAGREHVITVVNSLAKLANPPAVRVIALPGLAEKGDVSDWLSAGGTKEQLEALVSNAEFNSPTEALNEPQATSNAFPVVHILAGGAPEPPSMLVDEWLLKDVNIFGGHGGTGKSTVALLTAAHVALGRDVAGTKRVRNPGTVLLCLPEDGESGAYMILTALVNGLCLSADERALLATRLVMVPDSESVDLTRDAKRLGETARAHNAVLAIFDPLRNLIGDKNENDPNVASSTCAELRRELVVGANCAVLLCHHLRKPGKEADPNAVSTAHDSAGSAGWVNSSRLTMHFSKKDNRITVRAVKSNRMPANLKHELVLDVLANPENPAHWLSATLTDANAGATKGNSSDSFTPGIGRDLNANELLALRALDDTYEPGKRLSWSAWVDQSGIKKDTFRSVKERLINGKLAASIPTGKATRTGGKEYAYEITDTGRSLIHVGLNLAA